MSLSLLQRRLGAIKDYPMIPFKESGLNPYCTCNRHAYEGTAGCFALRGPHLDEHVFHSRGMGFHRAAGKPIIVLNDFMLGQDT